MNKKKIQYIMKEMIEELRECEDGTVTSTSELVQQLGYEDTDLIELHNALVSSAKAYKITLDFSAYDNEVVGLPYNIPFTVRNKNAQIKCPYCGSTDTARYIHGLPAFNERMKKKLDEGKWTLAGCLVNGVEINGKFENTMPSRHCHTCDKDFGTPSLLIAKKKEVAEDYRDIVESIKFSVGGYF